ncbi:YraN family protein [Candidatus Bipolaricaulota bacterium]|nr:YraN family protein [Candidatus Bipolaricaulota bacterium]
MTHKKTRQQLGKWAEDIACEFLRKHGYGIIERNWQSRFGEIDIIARDKGTLVFVEVKMRTSPGYGDAREAVPFWKCKRIITAARAYLMITRSELPARFDVVIVESKGISLYRDAFQVEETCSHSF